MATTLLKLKTFYSNVMRADFAHIPAAHQTLVANLSAQVDAGSITLAAAQTAVARLSIDTTSVATLAYNFFTGATPREGGLDYLVSPTGLNPNNLNSAYYQSANIENRYINFAVNLGKLGEGQTKFAADYGALNLSDTLTKAYTEIFGAAPDTAKVNAILNDQVANGVGGTYSRADYFAFYGRDGAGGIGTKAALVGWLMAEAAKADTGAYAKVNDAFLADLGADGVARFQSNLALAYGPPTPGTPGATIAFTPDQSAGPASSDPALQSTANNDTITGASLNAGQTLNGGAGNDTYTVSGTVYGRIEDSDGANRLTLGKLGYTPGGSGVPAVAGSVVLGGAGGNEVVLNGGSDPETSITATGTNNSIRFRGEGTHFGTFSGFQTVYIETPNHGYVGGAAVIYDMIPSTFGANQTVGIDASRHETVVLKDTSYGVRIVDNSVEGRTNVDVHLDHFTGALSTAFNTPIGGPPQGNGGAITVQNAYSYTIDLRTGLAIPNGQVTLHVDTDSTAGFVMGYGVEPGRQPNFPTIAYLRDLKIVGAGSLTAQLGGFTNVDATAAGDLNLTWSVVSGTSTFRLGDGTNTLKLFFATPISTMTSLSPPALAKIYLGAGADTLMLSNPAGVADPSSTTLSNIHIKFEVTAPPEIIGFQKGVDKLVLDAQIHAVTANVQPLADGRASLTEALVAVSAQTAVNTAAVFSYGGDTYVYAQDGRVGVNMVESQNALGDGLIKLVGVTGLTVGTGSGASDIHYG